jgi:uncharacterized protein DUF4325
MITIRIKDDFSSTPGHRSPEDGPHSGEKFLEEVLRPRYLEAVAKNEKIFVDLDGTAGYGTSFLEASFGGLAREFEIKDVLGMFDFQSAAEPYLIDEIKGYIRAARQKKQY